MFYANTSPTMSQIDLLLKAIADPEQFTPEQLEALLADPEMRRFYRLLSHTADAASEPSAIDVDAEWRRFAADNSAALRHSRFASWRRKFSLRAAASVIIVFALAAVSAGIAISRHASPTHQTQTDSDITHHSVTAAAVNADQAMPDTIVGGTPDAPVLVFENETLDAILARIASEHGAEVVFRSESPRLLRLYFQWHRGQELQRTVELLNGFDQINISLKNDTITVD